MANQNKNNYKRNNNYKKKGGKRSNDRSEQFSNKTERWNSVGDTTDKLSASDNDISWYVPNAQILRDVASLPFNQVVGLPYNVGLVAPGSTTSSTCTVPGIMRLDYISTWGMGSGSKNALNTAARNIYSFIRSENSGGKNYEAPDLMMYFMAMDGIYSYIHEMKRAYGVAQYYMYTNRYLAKTMLQSLGWDPAIIDDLAGFRYFINQCIQKVNKFNVPNVMPIMDRHEFLASHIFMDAPTTKAQFYAFCLNGFNMLAAYDESKQGFTELNLSGHHQDTGGDMFPWNMRNLLTAMGEFDDMYDRLMKDDDFVIMSGDIWKAYGNNCRVIDVMPTEYSVIPVYNSEVLPQIHNFRAVGQPVATRSETVAGQSYPVYTVVKQDPTTGDLSSGFDFYVPYVGGSSTVGERAIIDLRSSDPTPADVMIATRFTNLISLVVNSDRAGWAKGRIYQCATEVGTRMHIIRFTNSSDDDTVPAVPFNVSFADDLKIYSFQSIQPIGMAEAFASDDLTPELAPVIWKENLEFISQYSNFDWAPLLTVGYFDGSGTSNVFKNVGIISDLDNMTPIEGYVMERMHNAAILQELGIPFNGIHRG